MASLADDYRFVNSPIASSSSSSYPVNEDDEDEPIIGDSSKRDNGTYESYIRKGFEEENEDSFEHSTDRSHRRENGQVGVQASQENTELYSILNLDTNASTEDVLRAYRSWAVAFQ